MRNDKTSEKSHEDRLKKALEKIYRPEDIDQSTIKKLSEPWEVDMFHTILDQREEIDALNVVKGLMEVGLN